MNDLLPPVAWHNGQLIPTQELHVSIEDLGFRQGVVAVERLRTYDGRVCALESHIVRWRRTLEELYLLTPVNVAEIRDRIETLLFNNRDWTREFGDCGIVMLATPGVSLPSDALTVCNEMIHLLALNHQRVSLHRASGQPLFITDVEQPSGKCWPRDIKVRSRLHYYLADQQARQHHRDAVGVLVDHDGTVTETSVANLAIVRGGNVYSPAIEQVLPGVTQQIVQRSCERLGFAWHSKRLWPSEVREADEVWLMGTDGGLWFSNRVDGAPVGDGKPGSLYLRVLADFDRLVHEV
jgi:branched-chain amino acid aminotransferase